MKPKTPVTQILREVLTDGKGEKQWDGKLTVQKPFEF